MSPLSLPHLSPYISLDLNKTSWQAVCVLHVQSAILLTICNNMLGLPQVVWIEFIVCNVVNVMTMDMQMLKKYL